MVGVYMDASMCVWVFGSLYMMYVCVYVYVYYVYVCVSMFVHQYMMSE